MSSLFFRLLCGLCLLNLLSCHRPLEPYQTEHFDLIADSNTAEGYPMEVVEGRFRTSDGKGIPFGPEFLEGDWGHALSSMVSGDGTAPAPDSLDIRWYSYPEDKFYEGRFSLPQKKIYDLLKQGYWDGDDKKHDTYDELTVCLLPTGVAVVWLSGQNQVFIGRYQGHEIPYDFKRFNEAANRPLMVQQERAKMPARVQEEIRTGTLSTRQWDTYLKTYPWRVEAVMQDGKAWQPLTLYHHYIYYSNAERTRFPIVKGDKTYNLALLEPASKAIPTDFGLFVENSYGEKHEIRVDSLDEAETLAAFQSLAARHPTAPMVLRIEVDKFYSKYRLTLSNGFQTLPLDQAVVKSFEEE